SAEVRTETSVRRHAALCIALATWVGVWVQLFRRTLRKMSFAAQLAALREEFVTEMVFASGPRTQGSRRNAKALGTLFSRATSAA
ncbi:MAG: hypothetical protein ACT4PV_07365, partial [Planctomycetaceae bacterium]